jgi:hypothetical protein
MVGKGGFGVDDAGEGAGDPVQPLGRRRNLLARLYARNGPREAGPPQALPKAILPRRRQKSVHDLGSEPGPATVAGDLLGAGGSAGGVEDLDGLGEAADPRQGRYLLAAQPVRVAGAVPALIEGADGPGCPLREAQGA